MKLIIFKGDEDNLVICSPCYNDQMTESEKESFLSFVRNKDVPKLPDGSIRPSWIVDAEYLNDTRYLRDAWIVDNNGNLIFRRDKAEELKKKDFRYFRKFLFDELDFRYLKALEDNDKDKLLEVKNKKQILRDITTIDMSQYDTPEKLHKFIPDILKPAV